MLRNQGLGLGLGIEAGYQSSPRLAVALGLLAESASYSGPPVDSPFLTDYGTTRNVGVSGGVFSLHVMAPMKRFRPYVDLGLGIFRSQVKASGTVLFLIPVEEKRSEVGPSPVVGLGIDALLSEQAFIGLAVKRMWLSENFETLTGTDLEFGGTLFLVTFGLTYDMPRARSGRKPSEGGSAPADH